MRRVLNCASDRFLNHLPIVYLLTVVAAKEEGQLATRGLFVGDDEECLHKACALSLKTNFVMVEKPIHKAVVYLNPGEFQSTWLGNKAIYRTRMALADDAELVVLAPGVKEFGEDSNIDRLIRKYGYRGTHASLDAVARNQDLASDLSAAAHLIYGSSEGRFSITYCPGALSREEMNNAGYDYRRLSEVTKLYDPQKLKYGDSTLWPEKTFSLCPTLAWAFGPTGGVSPNLQVLQTSQPGMLDQSYSACPILFSL